MRNLQTFTLGEIETLLLQEPNFEMEACLTTLYWYIRQREKQAREFQVAKERAQMKAPREFSKRQCRSIEAEQFEACVLVEQ